MAIRIMTGALGTGLAEQEIVEVERMLARAGRVTLLVSSFRVRDICRRELARAGVGLGVDVVTTSEWIGSLWGVLGDGRQLVGGLERKLIMAQVLAEGSGGRRRRAYPGHRLPPCARCGPVPAVSFGGILRSHSAMVLRELQHRHSFPLPSASLSRRSRATRTSSTHAPSSSLRPPHVSLPTPWQRTHLPAPQPSWRTVSTGFPSMSSPCWMHAPARERCSLLPMSVRPAWWSSSSGTSAYLPRASRATASL